MVALVHVLCSFAPSFGSHTGVGYAEKLMFPFEAYFAKLYFQVIATYIENVMPRNQRLFCYTHSVYAWHRAHTAHHTHNCR